MELGDKFKVYRPRYASLAREAEISALQVSAYPNPYGVEPIPYENFFLRRLRSGAKFIISILMRNSCLPD
jgi:hypothetical protein